MRRSWLILVLSGSLALGAASALAEGTYTPRGLYEFERIRLTNGFEVILKQRHDSLNVSYRLVVKIGTRHFDCGRRETPHLLEHLLFSGTTRDSEVELERRVADLGGSWNALSEPEQTVYQLDIFDRYALEGIDLLHEVVTDTVLTPEKIDRAKQIVYREEGGRPGAFRRFLYRFGIGKAAWKKANEWLLPGDGGICRGLVNMEDITLDDLRSLYRTAYVPGNMTLIVVGNIDRKLLLDRLRTTFGAMPGSPRPQVRVVTPPEPAAGPLAVSSTLSPFLGSSGSYSVAFRTVGRSHPDAPALIVLGSLLNSQFYERVRIREGLSYAPEAVMFFQPDYGVFYVTADVGVSNISRVRRIMNETLDSLRERKLTPEEAEQTKRKILLQWAQGCETNASIAALYVERVLREDGLAADSAAKAPAGVPSYASEIEAVTADDLNRVIGRYLRPERRIDIRSAPTMSYTWFATAIGSVVVLVALIIIHRLREAAKRRRKTLPTYIRKF